MNYRIISTYIFLLGFFGFLAFAYINYSKQNSEKITNDKLVKHTEEIEEIVKKVIKENPEVLMQSLENYQTLKMKEAMAEAGKKIKANLAKLENEPNDPRVGAQDAKIKVVEFFDYNCGYCKRMANVKTKIIEENPDIEYVFKEFPILSEASVLAAKAALSINSIDKSKYKAFHLAILNHNGKIDEESLVNLSGKVGIDIMKFKKALNDPKWNEVIQSTHNLAREIGLGGTPTYIVGGEFVQGGGYEAISAKIKEAKAKQNMPATEANSGNSK